jgi:hypothetical protein
VASLFFSWVELSPIRGTVPGPAAQVVRESTRRRHFFRLRAPLAAGAAGMNLLIFTASALAKATTVADYDRISNLPAPERGTPAPDSTAGRGG